MTADFFKGDNGQGENANCPLRNTVLYVALHMEPT
jgi:hypothetical protein